MATKVAKRFYMEILKGQECQCGAWKRPGYGFCWVCARKLPDEILDELKNPIGRGFEKGYEEAVKFLSD